MLIIGGGVAGLWLLEELSRRGYAVLLVEQDALGGGQTAAAQGILHGGVKYALGGMWTPQARLSSRVLEMWRRCLEGTGAADLRPCRLLAESMHLAFLSGGRLAAWLVSRGLRSRVQPLPRSEWPRPFQEGAFRGNISLLREPVLDVPSLLSVLASRHGGRIGQAAAGAMSFLRDASQQRLRALRIEDARGVLEIHARDFVFAAGAGNAALLERLGAPRLSQTRPLHQVLVKHHYPHPLYAHFLEGVTQPRLTVSSHTTAAGAQLWYLGGALAEEGLRRDRDGQIAAARGALAALLPQLSLGDAQWATLRIDRAERAQRGGRLPSGPELLRPRPWRNLFAVWPGKLTWAPLLAPRLMEQLAPPEARRGETVWPANWPPPPVAQPPWESLF